MNFFVSLMIFASLDASASIGLTQAPANVTVGIPNVTNITKGAAIFASVCAACHAPDGNSLIPLNPKLAQQHPGYLIKQLTEFKAGKRANPIMLGMAGILGDDDIRNVAYWASGQKVAAGVAKNKVMVPTALAYRSSTPVLGGSMPITQWRNSRLFATVFARTTYLWHKWQPI